MLNKACQALKIKALVSLPGKKAIYKTFNNQSLTSAMALLAVFVQKACDAAQHHHFCA